jgi:EAL domain-containing protein (putative c-di-GMP-specific phosphodiesterase class I)
LAPLPRAYVLSAIVPAASRSSPGSGVLKEAEFSWRRRVRDDWVFDRILQERLAGVVANAVALDVWQVTIRLTAAQILDRRVSGFVSLIARLPVEISWTDPDADNAARVVKALRLWRAYGIRSCIEAPGAAAGPATLALAVRAKSDRVRIVLRGAQWHAGSPERTPLSRFFRTCRKSGLAVVASGVDTRDALAAAVALGATHTQGRLWRDLGYEITGIAP